MSLEHNVNLFINDLIDPAKYCMDPPGMNSNLIQSINEEDIFKVVVSSKYRKSKITQESEMDIKEKIHKAVLKQEMLSFSIPFGAYKAWRLELDFAPDWAEVFNIAYLVSYATEIIKVYPYGVRFYYTYQSGFMYFISDTPKEKAEEYYAIFHALLEIFNKISDKIKFNLVDIGDLYNSREDYYIDFLANFLDNLVNWDSKYEMRIRNRHFLSAMHNVYPYGNRKLSDQTEYMKGKYYFFSALMTDALDCLTERRAFNKGNDNIQLVCVKGPSKCINIGACETSTVHFWVGRGFLKQNKGKIKAFIYTYSNVKRLLSDHSNGKVIEIAVESPFRQIHRNYQNILYLP